MRALLILIALVGVYFFGMLSALGAVKRISPAAYHMLVLDLAVRKAKREVDK